ncbi:MAG: hypothetical protein C4K60_05155 [Ideonella sp. MAG2]|nr:MAG: hypothetical protein C4K60_05155 [Ideonella sp. MAG2]
MPGHTRKGWALAVSLRCLLPLALLALCLGQAQAEPASHWEVSGFGSVGVVSQHGAEGWRMNRNMTQAPADGPVSARPDSRLGVQLNWQLDTQWEAAVQAVSLSKPAHSPWRDSVEWAYLGYRPSPHTRIRLGRTNPDTYLYADSRNVGYALTWVRPPVDFYGFAPMAATDGVDLEHQWTLDDTRWRMRLTAGIFATMATAGDGSTFRIRAKDAYGFSLLREEGGLLLKASGLRTRLNMGMPEGFLQLKQGLAGLQSLPLPGLNESLAPLQDALWTEGQATYLALGAQYEHGPWTTVAEWSDLSIPKTLTGGRRAYGSVSYRLGTVSLYGLASRVSPHKNMPVVPDLVGSLSPVLGPVQAQQAQGLATVAAEVATRSRFDQGTVGLGLRWDATPQMALKFQIDRFRVYPSGSAAWMNGTASAARGNLVSVGLDFVWGP